MKTGNLVSHHPLIGFPNWGIGIVIETWDNQKEYEGVPPHSPYELIVLFNEGEKIVTRDELYVVSR